MAKYTGLLVEKFEKIPVGPVKECRLDDEKIAVQRYSDGTRMILVTRLGGKERLVYDPGQPLNGLVMADLDTWDISNCPVNTVEWLMEEHLRRLYACYPEEGFKVTSKAADEKKKAAREAAKKTAQEEIEKKKKSGL